MNNTYCVEFQHVYKKYKTQNKEVTALDGVCLTISSGSMASIVGQSGAGKSTFLQIAGTLDNPSSGRVLFNGQDTSRLSEKDLDRFRNESIGFIFQGYYLHSYLTSLDNVILPALIRGDLRKDALTRAMELIELVGMTDRYNHYPNELSGGEAQRIAIARSLMNNPTLLLADEPTGNLDQKNTEMIMELFLKIKAQGTTIVVVTHDKTLQKYFDSHFVFDKGKLIK